jgi:integrase
MRPRKPRERVSTVQQGGSRAELVLVQPEQRALGDVRPDLVNEAKKLADASLSEATRKAIRFDWEVFSAWCKKEGLCAMPATPDVAAGFLADQAKGKAVATLERYRATIGKLHKLNGHTSPFAEVTVKAVLEGIRRKHGVKQKRKAPADRTIITATRGDDLRAMRDHAVLLFGFMASIRGDELCRLNIEDLAFDDIGVKVYIKKSKTDQIGEGRTIGIERVLSDPKACPVTAVRAWIDELHEENGPLFRGFKSNGHPGRRLTRGSVNLIVKAAAKSAGLDPARYGAHSLRAGYVTESRKAGLPWAEIMEQTGHKRIDSVKRYDRGTINPYKTSKVGVVSEFVLGKKRQ